MILVVDARDDTRELVAELVASTGSYPVGVRDVAEALEVLAGVNVDAVVTDLALPGIDGLGLVRLLRESERHRSLPIVMFAEQTGEHVREELRHLDAEHLVKPEGLGQLITTLERTLAASSAA